MSHPEASIRLIISGKVNYDSLDFTDNDIYASSIYSGAQSSTISQDSFKEPPLNKGAPRGSLLQPAPMYPPHRGELAIGDYPSSRPESAALMSLCFSTTATKDGIEGKRPGRMLGGAFGPGALSGLESHRFDPASSLAPSPITSPVSLIGPLALQHGLQPGNGLLDGLQPENGLLNVLQHGHESRNNEYTDNSETVSERSFQTTNAECDGDSGGDRPLSLPSTRPPFSLKEKMSLLEGDRHQ